MEITLERFAYFEHGTLGRLIAGDFKCFALERAWHNNEVNVSCIPEGTYQVAPDEEGRYVGYPELKDVPGRSEIIIHPANWVHQIQGCIAPGMYYRCTDNSVSVGQSRAAWGKFIAAAGRTFKLDVTTRRALLSTND